MPTRSIDNRRALVIAATFAIAFATAAAAAPLALAQTTDPVAATELFKQGREAIANHDYTTACTKFEESARLDLKVGTLLNLADCQEHLGKIAAARQHLQRALDLATAQNDERAAIAKTRLAAIDKRVPRLTIIMLDAKIEGVRVRRDDVELGAGSFGSSLPVELGAHTVVVSAPEHEDKTFKITLSEAEQKTLTIDVGPETARASTHNNASTNDADKSPDRSGSGGTRTIGYVVAGVGVAAIATGAVFALIAINNNAKSKNTCTNNQCDQPGLDARNAARADGNIATGFFIGGAVAAAAGAVLVFTSSPSDPKKTAHRVTPIPIVSERGGGLTFGGSF